MLAGIVAVVGSVSLFSIFYVYNKKNKGNVPSHDGGYHLWRSECFSKFGKKNS